MHQHAAVVVGLVLPIDLAGIAAVTLALAAGDVEERRFRARIPAEIGEGGGLHADQRGQVLARAFQRQRRRIGSDAIRRRGDRRFSRDPLGAYCTLARRLAARYLAARLPFDAFGLAGEAILELRGREAVFETVAAGPMRVRGNRLCGRRLAALNQQGGERHHDGEEGDRAPTRRQAKRHRQTSAIIRRRFRIDPDHPPPKTAEPQVEPGRCLGNIKNPEELPFSGPATVNTKSCRDCGSAFLFSHCCGCSNGQLMLLLVLRYQNRDFDLNLR
jgi:hypothetical protein